MTAKRGQGAAPASVTKGKAAVNAHWRAEELVQAIQSTIASTPRSNFITSDPQAHPEEVGESSSSAKATMPPHAQRGVKANKGKGRAKDASLDTEYRSQNMEASNSSDDVDVGEAKISRQREYKFKYGSRTDEAQERGQQNFYREIINVSSPNSSLNVPDSLNCLC
ncbi:hypothetical protein UCRPC4_g03467 [Phaeomoniella chlamydospora]|uniref:Uncharacterized protein n=1 Tax=Phaeomoniella chlamydospora TaxID=158046 RepID=A0A0G2GYI7_PHACM|nr:hypothetical protein UCRPC4_g03467 [Phaeomoniella chlamydospora]